MSIFSLDENPFGMVFIIFPIITFIASLVLQVIIKKQLIIIGSIFICWLIVSFTLFNKSFLIWCLVYAVISIIGTLIANLAMKLLNKDT